MLQIPDDLSSNPETHTEKRELLVKFTLLPTQRDRDRETNRDRVICFIIFLKESKSEFIEPGLVIYAYHPSYYIETGGLKFMANLNNLVRPCFKIKREKGAGI